MIRHRGAARDKYGKLIAAASDVPLTPIGIAPGGGSRFVERAREGQTTAFTVYFDLGTDLISSDELTVRGERFTIIVNGWEMDGLGGLEVLCTRGQG